LTAEIEEIAAAINMDHWHIEKNYEPGELRTVTLELMKDKLIRGEVISCYTLLDELLTDMICDFYFRRGPKSQRQTYSRLWKTKRFRIFVHYIMDEAPLLKKLTLVDAIAPVPRAVRGAIERINTVRNALAHSFFPENRRRYMVDKKVMYQGVHLFSLDGVKKLNEDFNAANAYLLKRGFAL
jgi:hypothetical protein